MKKECGSAYGTLFATFSCPTGRNAQFLATIDIGIDVRPYEGYASFDSMEATAKFAAP
jgi:hypothetical protein